MKVSFYTYKQPYFGTNCRSYEKDGKNIGTQTYMFREDLDWDKFTEIINKNFRNKEKVNIIQFASSDGSEAYTQIISLLEKYPKTADKFFPIQAYDVDLEILNAAKSGRINISNTDINIMKENGVIFNRYFKNTSKNLYIPNDIFSYVEYMPKKLPSYCTQSYAVSPELTKRVNFKYGNMFDVIKNIKDNSDTIVLCRNILGYFSKEQVDEFLTIASSKLKSKSLLVTGFHDIKENYFEKLITDKGFKQVMQNVYRRI